MKNRIVPTGPAPNAGTLSNPSSPASHWMNERRRRLEALSDPWWNELVAEMNRHAKPKVVHTAANRDRTAFDGWEC